MKIDKETLVDSINHSYTDLWGNRIMSLPKGHEVMSLEDLRKYFSDHFDEEWSE